MGLQASAVSTTDDERVVQSFIHAQFVDLFLSQSKRAQAGQVVSALLVGFIWMQPLGRGGLAAAGGAGHCVARAQDRVLRA